MYRSPPLFLAGTHWGRVVVITRKGQRGGTLLGHKARLIGDPQSPRQVATIEVSNWLRPLVQKSTARDVIVCVYLYFRRLEWVNRAPLSCMQIASPSPSPFHGHLIRVSSTYPFSARAPLAQSLARSLLLSLSAAVYVCEPCQGWRRTSRRL